MPQRLDVVQRRGSLTDAGGEHAEKIAPRFGVQVAQEAEQSFVIVVGVGLFDVPEHEDQIAENVGDDAGLCFLHILIDKVCAVIFTFKLCGIHGGTAAHGNEAIGFEIEPVGFAQVVRVLKHAASEKQVLYELAAGGLQVIGKMFLEHFKQALVFLGGFDLFLRPHDDRDQVFGIDGL